MQKRDDRGDPVIFLCLIRLIVFSVDFEVSLGVCAGGAKLGSIGANHQVTAVAAFPDLDFALGEDLGGLHVLQQCAIALFVVLFNGSHHPELCSQLGEAFLFSGTFFGIAFLWNWNEN